MLEDASSGAELYKIQEKKLTIRDRMEIERGGATVATVKEALIIPLRDRFSIEVEGGEAPVPNADLHLSRAPAHTRGLTA